MVKAFSFLWYIDTWKNRAKCANYVYLVDPIMSILAAIVCELNLPFVEAKAMKKCESGFRPSTLPFSLLKLAIHASSQS